MADGAVPIDLSAWGAKGRLGFGFMRPPTRVDGSVDLGQARDMVDAFLDAGFNYFDVARPYVGGACEQVLHECLTSRHPRGSYVLVDKLSAQCFQAEADIRPLIKSQLAACEAVCPQHLPIRELLRQVAAEFEQG